MCCQEICNACAAPLPQNADSARDKAALRAIIKQKATLLEQEKGLLAVLVCKLPVYQAAQTVFVFVGARHEPDTLPLIKQMLADGKIVCVPRCEAQSGVMFARRILSIDALSPGHFGILEPDAGAALVPPNAIDLAVMPCLSADGSGGRLGYGGGYYDRFLQNTRCFKVVLCRKELVLDAIPMDAWDIRADLTLIR